MKQWHFRLQPEAELLHQWRHYDERRFIWEDGWLTDAETGESVNRAKMTTHRSSRRTSTRNACSGGPTMHTCGVCGEFRVHFQYGRQGNGSPGQVGGTGYGRDSPSRECGQSRSPLEPRPSRYESAETTFRATVSRARSRHTGFCTTSPRQRQAAMARRTRRNSDSEGARAHSHR